MNIESMHPFFQQEKLTGSVSNGTSMNKEAIEFLITLIEEDREECLEKAAKSITNKEYIDAITLEDWVKWRSGDK